MISIVFNEIISTLLMQNRSYSNEAIHNLRTDRPDITVRHTGVSPINSINSFGFDRFCGDLTAYILVWKNCLEMQNRNRITKASVQATDFEALQAKAQVFDNLMKDFLKNGGSAHTSQTIGSAIYSHIEEQVRQGEICDTEAADIMMEHLRSVRLLVQLETLYKTHQPLIVAS